MGWIMGQYIKGTKEEVEFDLQIINQIIREYWAGLGYTVTLRDGLYVLIGKNALSDENTYDAVTTQWDNAKPIKTIDDLGTPDVNTLWWAFDPSFEPRFVDWRDRLPDGILLKCESVNEL